MNAVDFMASKGIERVRVWGIEGDLVCVELKRARELQRLYDVLIRITIDRNDHLEPRVIVLEDVPERDIVIIKEGEEEKASMTLSKLSTIQKKENLNEVYRHDTQGPGGACHEYTIVRADTQQILEHIEFQKGARQDPDARHGVLDCDLLEIVRDRLKEFQEGPYACHENARALMYLEQALIQMNLRVEDRIARNVLGTMEK